jgi:hypothetical protein
MTLRDFRDHRCRMGGMKRLLLASVVLLALLSATAHADLGPPRLSRSTGRPGEIITGRAPRGMPVLMILAQLAPHRYSCHGNGICEPYSVGAPSRSPWFRLGRLAGPILPITFGTIRLRVPRARPGPYKIFLYCEPCYRGKRGSLITDDRIFRVLPQRPR